MKNKDSLDFAYKEHTIQGMISCGLFLIAFLIVILTLRLSWQQKGESGLWAGAAGLLSLFLNGIGTYMGCRGIRIRERVEKKTAWFGFVANGLMVLTLVGLYIWGYVSLF
ncbi:MAG: hypothetical protein ACI4C1_00240 [Lachnospiraceae bacterium]